MKQITQEELDTVERLIGYHDRKAYEADIRGDMENMRYHEGAAQATNQMWHLMEGSKDLELIIAESTDGSFK